MIYPTIIELLKNKLDNNIFRLVLAACKNNRNKYLNELHAYYQYIFLKKIGRTLTKYCMTYYWKVLNI